MRAWRWRAVCIRTAIIVATRVLGLRGRHYGLFAFKKERLIEIGGSCRDRSSCLTMRFGLYGGLKIP
jgi:hypothetical protein